MGLLPCSKTRISCPRSSIVGSSPAVSVLVLIEAACIGSWLPAPAVTMFSRSEEHTSELQSLMRISYAVFCLKKKKTDKSQQQAEYLHVGLLTHELRTSHTDTHHSQ